LATKIKAWQILNGVLKPIDTSLAKEGRKEAYDLESWIASNPTIIGSDLAIIGRQVQTKSGPLDLLAIDNDGNLVIIELKRDVLPREALAQAIDYASDISDWSIDKISEICLKYTSKSLEDIVNEHFPDVILENISINANQRIILIGFAIEESLERMIGWLSDNYGFNINAILLNYVKTINGEELLTQTTIISEEKEQSQIKKKKFQIPLSDEPGQYSENELKELLIKYFSQDLFSARRIRDILLPALMEREYITRDELKNEFVLKGEAEGVKNVGYFLSLISLQIGMKKNDFLRQIIGYEYPNYAWEKDNYKLVKDYKRLVATILESLNKK
jgi:hypothetical protein